ncbi:serine/threonine transporter [Candidatus Williamhamiltonella defendens]|uniref:serine/threonine transporter n=1 Tax=Candidatus Williamhamiltonella defendens TaxID=138072 RepID=UPI001582258F|nr:serine/threonine transporter [Candidatus Hamiltonella defensa]
MKIIKNSPLVSKKSKDALPWSKNDTMWMLSLYGTAIGAGVLFLPINAGIGGLLPLIVMTLIAFPMTFFAHRGLCRFVLSGAHPDKDITEVVEEHFGVGAGKLITLLYFFTIYPILLVYSVAITNTVESFLIHQMHISPPPRVLLSFTLIFGLMSIVHFGKNVIVKAMSILVFPFIFVLMLLTFYLIPYWSDAIFSNVFSNETTSTKSILMTLWLIIPVMVFSFNHSPIISAFAVASRKKYGVDAEKKCGSILAWSHIMMVITVMMFVFSCVLSLSPSDLVQAKSENISILSYLANHYNRPLIAYIAPIIAFIAISKSFLGHYLGVQEGFNRLVIQLMCTQNKKVKTTYLNRITAIFMLISTWIVATLNPSILGIIETLSGPVIAILLYLMPMYAIHKIPAMRQYSGYTSNIFVVIMGLMAISAILYNLLDFWAP